MIYKKVIVVGASSVGKTTIIQQLLEGNTSDVGPSVKCSTYKKIYDVNINGNKTRLILTIWDTPGADNFDDMRELDYKGADVAVMVYAIDKDSTLENVDGIVEKCEKFCNPPPLFFLVGNKVDLDEKGLRVVEKKDA